MQSDGHDLLEGELLVDEPQSDCGSCGYGLRLVRRMGI